MNPGINSLPYVLLPQYFLYVDYAYNGALGRDSASVELLLTNEFYY